MQVDQPSQRVYLNVHRYALGQRKGWAVEVGLGERGREIRLFTFRYKSGKMH